MLVGMAATLCHCTSLFAQSNVNNASAALPDFVVAQNTALTLFVQGDVANAQRVLFSTNLSAVNSLEADLESGQKLASLAAALKFRREYARAIQAANLAVVILTGASKGLVQANKRLSAARACETLAVLQQEVLRDDQAAKNSFAQALVNNPQSPRALKDVAKRNDVEAELAKKSGSR